MSLVKKFIKHFKEEGFIKSIYYTFEFLNFRLRIKLTSTILKILSSLKRTPLHVTHGGSKLYFTNDGDYEEILYHAHWQKYFHLEREKVKDYIKEGDSVMDIGANIGLFTLLLSNLIGNNGKVHSFEPSSKVYTKLNMNINLNKLKNIETYNYALGEQEGELEIFLNPNQSGLSSISNKASENCISEKIKMNTLDQFSVKLDKKVSFIKIDTEGYEPQVLKGGLNLLEKDKPVIYIELGGRYLESSYDALNLLKKLNYNCEAYNIDLASIPEGINFIAIPEGYTKL